MNKELDQFNNLLDENSRLQKDFISLQSQQFQLENWLDKIYKAKSYKYWQSLNRIKKTYIGSYLNKTKGLVKVFIQPSKNIIKQIYLVYYKSRFIYKKYIFRTEILFNSKVAEPKVSILIPTYGNTKNLDILLKSISKFPPKYTYEIIIINDNPDKKGEVISFIKKHKSILKKLNCKILGGNYNMGFVHSINTAANKAIGKYLFLLNDDTEVISKRWIDSLVDQIEKDSNIGACGSLLLYPDKQTVQHAGMYPFRKDDSKIYNYHYYKFFNKDFPLVKESRSVPMITGAALLISKSTFKKLKGMNDKYLGAGGFDDSDLCNRIIKSGLQIFFVSESQIIHHEGLTFKRNNLQNKLIFFNNISYYQKRWEKFLIDKYPQYV